MTNKTTEYIHHFGLAIKFNIAAQMRVVIGSGRNLQELLTAFVVTVNQYDLMHLIGSIDTMPDEDVWLEWSRGENLPSDMACRHALILFHNELCRPDEKIALPSEEEEPDVHKLVIKWQCGEDFERGSIDDLELSPREKTSSKGRGSTVFGTSHRNVLILKLGTTQ